MMADVTKGMAAYSNKAARLGGRVNNDLLANADNTMFTARTNLVQALLLEDLSDKNNNKSHVLYVFICL